MLKKKTPIKVIAINPGWRYLGITVFEDLELREWRLKSLQGIGAKEKTEKVKGILLDFIERYDPNTLAIKKLHPARSSANLCAMALSIQNHCRKEGLKIFSYSIQEMKSILSPENRINKKELAELMAAEYPALIHELNCEKRSRAPYYQRLFEAVALGHTCLQGKIKSNLKKHEQKDSFQDTGH